MTATPLSLHWERAQHVDRSAIESHGLDSPGWKRMCSSTLSAGGAWDLPSE
jgi:hypothetical protein